MGLFSSVKNDQDDVARRYESVKDLLAKEDISSKSHACGSTTTQSHRILSPF